MAENPVLRSAYAVAEQAQQVKVNKDGIRAAGKQILERLESRPYTVSAWSSEALHPDVSRSSPEDILDWIFLVSALNFSFWSDLGPSERFGILWKTGTDGKEARIGEKKMWTGYWSLLAALHRAKETTPDITRPAYYSTCDEANLRNAFKSDQKEEMPLLDERIRVMRDVGSVLCESFGGSYANIILQGDKSALKVVDIVCANFGCFDDQSIYKGQTVFIRKRAQILVAETWAAFEGKGFGEFYDIDKLTMFADYRVPQILQSLGTITYSEALIAELKKGTNFANGSEEEIEIRCCSIVAVDKICLEIKRAAKVRSPSFKMELPNAVLLDFMLWDLAKAEEAKGLVSLPHHRTRSVFY